MTDEMKELVQKLRDDLSPGSTGATGKYPQGKLVSSDEGELKMALASSKGKVVLEFGKPVHWIGFDAASARSLGEALIEHSKRVAVESSG